MISPEQFDAVLKESFEKEIKIYPARTNWPSEAGHPCTRYLVWRRTRWQEQKPHDATLQSIFGEGRLHQPSIIARLTVLGFEITETDRPFEYGGYSGRIDGKFKSYRGERFHKPIPFEAKSCSPYAFDAITTEQDISESEHHYVRGWRHQLALYMLMDNIEIGYYVLKNKLTGWLKLIPSQLDWALADSLVKHSKEIDEMVNAGLDPEPITYTRAICGRCGFRDSCFPGRDYGQGALLQDDPDFLSLIGRWFQAKAEAEQVKPILKAFEILDKDLSERVKEKPFVMAGEFIIEGEPKKRKSYSVKESVGWSKTIRKVGETDKQEETEAGKVSDLSEQRKEGGDIRSQTKDAMI